MDPMNVPANFEGRSFTRSWDNSGYLLWAVAGFTIANTALSIASYADAM